MALVGPRSSGGGGRSLWAFSTVAGLVIGPVAVAGGLGDDFRWLGGLALSELVVTRGLRWLGVLAGRPWVRLGLRLGTAAVLLHGMGIAMPDAWLVGGAFLCGAVGCLAWLGVLRLAGVAVARGGEWVAVMALVAAIGWWFAVVGVPASGWSPIVAILVGATAVDAARFGAPEGPTP